MQRYSELCPVINYSDWRWVQTLMSFTEMEYSIIISSCTYIKSSFKLRNFKIKEQSEYVIVRGMVDLTEYV